MMNKQDKEAFKLWGADQDGDLPLLEGPAYEAWQAACNYKEKELDILKLEYDKLTDWASEYVAENAKLKEALKNCPILGEVHRDSNDRFKEWNLEYKYVLKELENK